MNIYNKSLLKRIREPSTEGSELIFEGQDLTGLLLWHPDAFSEENRAILVKCYEEYGQKVFEKLASDNKITPFVAHVLIDLDCDKVFWKEKHDNFVLRNTAIKALLESIFVDAQSYSCESVTLTENFAAVLSSNACIGCFCSGDVDLSADITEKDQIIKWLKKFDFLSKEQPASIGEYSGQSMQFFNSNVIDGGFWINVIWKPVTRAFLVQNKYEVRLTKDRLLARPKDGSSIKILEDTSLLYFCALHISAGHYFTLSPGLRLYVDIDRLVRNSHIDWDNIVKWEKEDNAGIRISMIMFLSYKLFNTPIPKRVYAKLSKSMRSQKLIDYLYDAETNQIQTKSTKYHRLYVELASDNKLIITNFGSRVLQLIISKLKRVNL